MKETITACHPNSLHGVNYDSRQPWDFIIGASTFGPPQNPTAYWWDCQLVRALASPHSTVAVVAALEGRQSRPLAGAFADQAARPNREPRAPKAACAFCGRPGHTEDACYSKHGKPTKAGAAFHANTPLLRPSKPAAGGKGDHKKKRRM